MGKAKYDVLEVSRHIINYSNRMGYGVSNLKLQKLLYFVQAYFLAFTESGTPCFKEKIEAWQFGPVVPNVYYYFCGYGAMKIMNYYDEDFSLNYEDRQIIDKIIIEKRDMDPWQLVEETYRAGGAWDKTYKKGFGNREVISIALIKQEIANA